MTVLIRTRLMHIEQQDFDVGTRQSPAKFSMIVIKGTDAVSPATSTQYDDSLRSLGIVARTPAEVREAAYQLIDAGRQILANASKLATVSTEMLLEHPTTPITQSSKLDAFTELVALGTLSNRPATREAFRRRIFEALHHLEQMDKEEAKTK